MGCGVHSARDKGGGGVSKHVRGLGWVLKGQPRGAQFHVAGIGGFSIVFL